MATALLADAHLGGPGGPATPLVAELAGLPGRAERLVLLGDLFQVWIGHRKFETADVVAVVEALERLRQRGLEVVYVEGNRDFFLAGSRYSRAFDVVAGEYAFVEGGRRYLAVHGDGLDDKDWKYRFWRRLSKSGPSRLAARAIPGPVARRIVHGTERALAQTNFKHKMRIPEEVVRTYATRRLAEGHDALLVGHFHEERRWSVPGGEVWLLEAWFRTRRLEWLGSR
ncbi:MAG: UDP-2,3-diacylglucosamine diphosphatase [Holophagales bacterium]|nr:MAG: UDP-2,3-diacylglucosamine diphosphatase [Holophagales bacterium]